LSPNVEFVINFGILFITKTYFNYNSVKPIEILRVVSGYRDIASII